jgi:hypothetical protein
MADAAALTVKRRFRYELADFWHFVRYPTPGRRLPPRRLGSSLAVDWWTGGGVSRILAWAVFLWTLNLCALAPLAAAAADRAGTVYRLDVNNIPWFTAILWAPVVEEMLFRYGLRRPLHALWLSPGLLLAMWWGPRSWTIALVGLLLFAGAWPLRSAAAARHRWNLKRCRYYHTHFGVVFHGMALAFAAMHLSNFVLGSTAYWTLPLLVLPQWVTGLVLGWTRVRRGIGASIALHAVFNGGPVLMIWVILHGLVKTAP